MKVFFVRHSESVANSKGILNGLIDYDLSQNGILQSENLREIFKNEKFDVIYSSPLIRAHETAKIVFPQAQIRISEYLIERNFNSYEGVAVSEINMELLEKVSESQLSVIRRITKFINVLYKEYESRPEVKIIVFTHNSIIRHFDRLLSKLNATELNLRNAEYIVYEYSGNWKKIKY